MRDGLIEMIQNSVNGCARHWAEIIADYLLANSVVVLPCKVGDTVYLIDYNDYKPCLTKGDNGEHCPHIYAAYDWYNNCRKTSSGVKPIDCVEIKPIKIESIEQIFKYWECFGKTMFFSMEDAVQALKGGAE